MFYNNAVEFRCTLAIILRMSLQNVENELLNLNPNASIPIFMIIIICIIIIISIFMLLQPSKFTKI